MIYGSNIATVGRTHVIIDAISATREGARNCYRQLFRHLLSPGPFKVAQLRQGRRLHHRDAKFRKSPT